MDGVRDAIKKSQIRGTHNAAEALGSRAGSKQKRATSKTSHVDRTKVGDIRFNSSMSCGRYTYLENLVYNVVSLR